MSLGMNGPTSRLVNLVARRYRHSLSISYQNDFLSWLIEKTEGPKLTVKLLTTRIMVVNFAAVYVSPDVISSHT